MNLADNKKLQRTMDGLSALDDYDVLSWDDATSSGSDAETVDSIEVPDPEAYFDAYCDQYIDFTNDNPTTFHAVQYFRSLLDNNGFTFIDEAKPISVEMAEVISRGGLFYTVRAGLTILPFIIGGKWRPEHGAGVVGSHVDALALKLKPSSVRPSIDGYNMLGVANYSGTLNQLWLDRDLGIGGAVLIRENGKIKRRLIKSSPNPIARIPSLAPHFGLKPAYNKETQMVPIIGYGQDEQPTDEEKQNPLTQDHPISLLRYISQLAGVKLADLVRLELDLFDVERAVRGGLDREFLFAPRIDDRLCSFSAIYGLIEYSKQFFSGDTSLANYTGLNMVLLVDHEEIGSASRTGVQSRFLNATIDRLCNATGNSTEQSVVYANSIVLSADVTHAMNPNFKSSYLEGNYPLPNKGMTIKIDANQRVMSESVGVSLLHNIAHKNNFELQKFHIRNDYPSGGTIGPYLATATGARVIDIGLPQLSMHSIRASCGYKEVGIGVNFFRSFFKDWRSLYDNYEGL